MNKPNEVNVLSLGLSEFDMENPYSQSRYGNFINGEFVAPHSGEYFDNVTPVSGQPFCQIARSNEQDIESALDAAHAAADAWGRTSPAERSNLLNRIANTM